MPPETESAPKKRIRVLILEDRSTDAELAVRELRRAGFEPDWLQVQTEAEFVARLHPEFDIILADYQLPQFTGMQALELLQQRGLDIPLIVVSGSLGDELAAECIKRGATDYLLKDRLARLGQAVARALEDKRLRGERTRDQEARLSAEARFRGLVEQSLVGIYVIQDDRFVYVNPKMTDIFGFSPEELTSAPLVDFIFEKDRALVSENIRKRLEGAAESIHYSLRALRKDGKVIYIEAHGGRTEYSGRPAILGTLLDVTEKRSLEAQLLRAQRMESVGRLASGIAHDLNNILAPILMAVPILRWGQTPKEAEHTLGMIEQSAQRGVEIIKQLLTFGRGLQGERVVLQLRHLINDIVRVAQETFPKNIRIQSRIARGLWPITGDATQMHQVLLNLAVNARDAMPQGGTLTLAAENAQLDETYASMNPDAKPGPYVVFRVSDTGEGIPPEILDKIFDPFFTTKEPGKGTGLGLSTVLGIAQSHGGFLKVNSKPGAGATFEVYLPAVPEGVPPVPPSVPETGRRGHGELILIVDDEVTIREVTQKVLEKSGYRAVTAADGTEALARFVEHKHEIKLVLTDLMMPIMDGLTLIRTLRKLDPKLPIIPWSGIGSAGSQRETQIELRELGVKTPLSKPFTAEKLLNAIHEILTAE
ncbi:MAG: hybrid sensor histidine kinase/response regulator [Limisphaerales bacterium]